MFSVACGSHTHFFAASSPSEAKVGWGWAAACLPPLQAALPFPAHLDVPTWLPPTTPATLPSHSPAQAWVEAITTAWLRCVKHTSRGAHIPSAEEALAVKEAHWRAESAALRRSLAEAEQPRMRESTAHWQAQAAALAQPVEQPVRQCWSAHAAMRGGRLC